MSEENDLLFFTGFEGCRNNSDLHGLSTGFGSIIGPDLREGSGFLGSKCMYIHRAYSEFIPFPSELSKIFFGFHMSVPDDDTEEIFWLENSGSNITVDCDMSRGILKIYTNGGDFNVDVSITAHLYFHIDVYINDNSGEFKIKINGVTIFNKIIENMNIGEFEKLYFKGTGLHKGLYLDNIWIHKSKSLGQVIALLSQPDQDGYYNDNFHTHDEGSGEIYPYLETNDGDDSYIYSSVPDAKFTCNFEDIPEGFTPLAFAVQKVFKHTTGGGLLYVQDFARLKGEDYTGDYIAPPDVYKHSHLFRTNYSGVFNGFELNRENINSGEFGIKLIEL